MKNLNPTLMELLSEKETIENVKKNYSKNVDILPAESSLRKFLKIDTKKIQNVINDLDKEYDYIIMDSPPGISKNSITPIEISDQLIIVTTPDEASVSSAENTQRVGNILEKKLKGYILNKWKEKGFFAKIFGEETQMSEKEIQGRLGTNKLGTIPYDKNVKKSTELQKPLFQYKEGSKAIKAIKNITEQITTKTKESEKEEGKNQNKE